MTAKDRPYWPRLRKSALPIHAFRMPTFFMITGIFGAVLFYEPNKESMTANRVSHTVFPFLVFLFVLSPLRYSPSPTPVLRFKGPSIVQNPLCFI